MIIKLLIFTSGFICKIYLLLICFAPKLNAEPKPRFSLANIHLTFFLVTIGSKDIDIRTGHSIHLPVKTPFKLKNEADSPVEFVGFCINAGSLENLAFSEAREISD